MIGIIFHILIHYLSILVFLAMMSASIVILKCNTLWLTSWPTISCNNLANLTLRDLFSLTSPIHILVLLHNSITINESTLGATFSFCVAPWNDGESRTFTSTKSATRWPSQPCLCAAWHPSREWQWATELQLAKLEKLAGRQWIPRFLPQVLLPPASTLHSPLQLDCHPFQWQTCQNSSIQT